MPNPFRRSVSFPAGALVPALLLCLSNLVAPSAIAQSTPPPPATGAQKQLDRMDFAISAAGIITSTVSGTEQRDQTPLTIVPSSTVGELVTLRYTAHPYVGFEFNFSNSRYNQNFLYTLPTQNYLPGGVQNTAREYTLGYIAHPHRTFFGVQPFFGAGGGTMSFTPTTYGGEGLKQQYRAVYYYTLGGEMRFPDSHFGIRAGFRQLIYLAPDFGQNYITITRRPTTSEPTVGFFVRF
jgi:hypothetical protein